MSKNKIKAENGYRIIGGALTIKAGDKVFYNGAWQNVSNSIGMTVAQAKLNHPKSAWARKSINGQESVPQVHVLNNFARKPIVLNKNVEAGEVQNANAVPKGYVNLAFGSYKQKGDMFLSETGQWLPVNKSIGKIYKYNAKNKVVRPVAIVVANQPAVVQQNIAPAPINKNDSNRFKVGQKIKILESGDASYNGLTGTIVFARPSRHTKNKTSYFIDLDKSPETTGNEALNIRGEYLSEA